jgi:hypothetical protein
MLQVCRAPWVVSAILIAVMTATPLVGSLPVRSVALAQSPAPRRNVPKELQPLLSADVDTWLAALAELRRNPQARELLLQGLEVQPPPERRWRLIHHLAEFGSAEDVAVLVPLLENQPEGLERRVTLGTLRSLYPAPDVPPDLSAVVRDFAYLQTAPPTPYATEFDNKVVMTEVVLQTYWLDRVPPQVMVQLIPMKGRRFDSAKSAAEGVQSRVPPRLWQDSSAALIAPLTAVPPRLVQEGSLRYRVENPLKRPLLLSLDASAWFGRLEEAVPRRYLYLKPGESVQVDTPIRVIGPKDPGRVRIDLRIREVNGGPAQALAKLYVTMQG